MRSRGARAALGGLSILAASCEAVRTDDSSCTLEPAQVVAAASAPNYQGVALDARGTRIVAAYSSREGLYVRALDERAVPRESALRVGDACSGGVDVEVAKDRVLVACARRSEGGSLGGVTLYTLDDTLHTTFHASLGDVGRDGKGIDVEVDGDLTYVLYHDGSVGVHAVKLVTIRGGSPSERVLSRSGHAAADPSLRLFGKSVYATWSETTASSLSASQTEVVISRDQAPAQVVTRVNVLDPAPHLAEDERGLVLTYRDRQKLDRKAELYLGRLDAGMTLVDTPYKVGRANTDGAPSLFTCGTSHLALLPREYGGENYIAIHTLDPALENIGGGHQFYGNSRDYVQAAGACVGESLLLLAAERKTPADTGVEIAAMRFSCAEGEATSP